MAQRSEPSSRYQSHKKALHCVRTFVRGDASGRRAARPSCVEVILCPFHKVIQARKLLLPLMGLAAKKIQIVRVTPTSWKWVILALQNAVQAAMVLALSGTDGCGALYPR